MTLFLLCDVVCATFGKINLKNLKKIQKLDLSKADNYALRSRLGQDNSITERIHDGVTHTKIPASLSKRFGYDEKEAPYMLLNKLKGDDGQKYNRKIEKIANGVEGLERFKYDSPEYRIGRALRKKKLSAAEKITTRQQNSSVLTGLIEDKTTKPTQDQVDYLISNIKSNSTKPPRITPKIKGSKPQPQNIEQKKQGLKQKYGIA